LLAGRFSDRYAILVIVVCLGGMLTGTLLTAVLFGQGLLDEPLVIFEHALAVTLASMLGAWFGMIIGLVEDLILAFPLATIFGGDRG
jgi:hypothetical protein